MLIIRSLLSASICLSLIGLSGCGSDSNSRNTNSSNTSATQQQNQNSSITTQASATSILVPIDYAQLKPTLMAQIPNMELSMVMTGQLDLATAADYQWSTPIQDLQVGQYQIRFFPYGDGHAAGFSVMLDDQPLAQWNFSFNMDGQNLLQVRQVDSNAGKQLLLVSTGNRFTQGDGTTNSTVKPMPWNPNELRLLKLTWVDIEDLLAPQTLHQMTLTGKVVAQSSDEDTMYLVTEYIASTYGILGLSSEFFDQWLQLSDAEAAAHNYGSVFTAASISTCLTDYSDTPILYRVSAINLRTAELTDAQCVHGAIDQAQFDSQKLVLRSASSGDLYQFETSAGMVNYLSR